MWYRDLSRNKNSFLPGLCGEITVALLSGCLIEIEANFTLYEKSGDNGFDFLSHLGTVDIKSTNLGVVPRLRHYQDSKHNADWFILCQVDLDNKACRIIGVISHARLLTEGTVRQSKFANNRKVRYNLEADENQLLDFDYWLEFATPLIPQQVGKV